METEKAYYTGIHRYSFRMGKAGEIIGVVLIDVEGEMRPCYHIRYPDGAEDYSPIYDNSQNFRVEALEQIKSDESLSIARDDDDECTDPNCTYPH